MRERPIVWFGSYDPQIKDLQQLLADRGLYVPRKGYEDAPDHFGPVTDAAVRAFQNVQGLNPDGMVDAYIWSLLDNRDDET